MIPLAVVKCLSGVQVAVLLLSAGDGRWLGRSIGQLPCSCAELTPVWQSHEEIQIECIDGVLTAKK